MADNKNMNMERWTEVVSFRMNKPDLAQLTSAARALGVSRSALIRDSVQPVVKAVVKQRQGSNEQE